jgi:hypothetical protein
VKARRAPRFLAILLPWGAAVVFAIVDHLRDPYDPARTGTQRYGHNTPGALGWTLAIMTFELVVLLAMLQPSTYERSWGRALGAFAVFAPASLLSALFATHAGGIMAIHLLWMLGVTFGLFVLTVVSVAARHS